MATRRTLVLLMTLMPTVAWSAPATLDCVLEAAHRQSVPANVLLAVASIEGGKNNQYVRNTNGSYDMGHFQINTIHWKKGGAFYQHPTIRPEIVASNGCYNAELAAWLIGRAIRQSNKQEFWAKVADYHSKTPEFNRIYRKKLIPLAKRWGDWLQVHYASNASIENKQVSN